MLIPVRGGHTAIQQMEKLRVPGQEGQASGIYGCARVGHRAGGRQGSLGVKSCWEQPRPQPHMHLQHSQQQLRFRAEESGRARVGPQVSLLSLKA